MQSILTSAKLKKCSSGNLGSHLATYQGQIIRNSGSAQQKKQKSNRRVITEHSEKNHGVCSQIKKATKQFRLPFKSTSPKLKKTHESHTNSNKKLLLTTNTNLTKKKSSANTANTKPFVHTKVYTQTGGQIKKKKINPADKKILFIKQDKVHHLRQAHKKETHKKEQKTLTQKKNIHDKTTKIIQNKKSNDLKKQKSVKAIKNTKTTNPTEYHKMRLKTQGNFDTFDSTPSLLNNKDIQILGMIGQGTFGKVYKGKIIKTGQFIAIKKVFQDPKYKNRQIQIVQLLNNNYVMKVLGTYLTVQNHSQYLNIIMDFYDQDLYHYIKEQNKHGLNIFDIKLITYQIFRGLNYIHSLGICHRDIKPHNILIKGKKIVICDFGSAKILTHQPNLPYICSRCYRAPELIFGATHYSTMIDIWSVGCVLLQMIQGIPLFIGESSIDHLIQIIKVMGTPTKTQVIDMNPDYDLNDYKFPKIKKKQWHKIFPKMDQNLLDLLSQIMIYSPNQRLNAAQALCHQFFDELRDQKTYKYVQKHFGLNLFDFTQEQIEGKQHLLPKLIPDWLKN